MNTGGLIIGLLLGGLSLLCIICVAVWKKGKSTGLEKGRKLEYEECNKRLIQMHNAVTGSGYPDGMSESEQKWGVSPDKSKGRMESGNPDVH
jgi:hypothetical protein